MYSVALNWHAPAAEPDKAEVTWYFSSILPDIVAELAGREKAKFTHPYLTAVCKTHYNSRLNWQSVPLIACSHLKYLEKPDN